MYAQAKRDAIAWLAFKAQMIAERALDEAMTAARFRTIKRQVAKLEGRIGRLTPKTYR
jgi:hypothetical protein